MSEILLAAAAVGAVALPALALYAAKLRKLKAEYEETRDDVRYAFRTYRQRLDSHEAQVESLTRSVNDSTGSLRWLRGRVLGQERRIAKAAEAALLSLEASKRTLDHSLEMEGRLKELELQVEKGREALKGLDEIESLRREISAITTSHEAPAATAALTEAKAGATTRASMPDPTLARLTETELQVLEILRIEGAKTSRELERLIGRTREHTARIMKKLYLEGYVDRDTHKLPYVYRVNEKLKAALQKSS